MLMNYMTLIMFGDKLNLELYLNLVRLSSYFLFCSSVSITHCSMPYKRNLCFTYFSIWLKKQTISSIFQNAEVSLAYRFSKFLNLSLTFYEGLPICLPISTHWFPNFFCNAINYSSSVSFHFLF